MEVVALLSQGRTAAVQCGLFTHKSVPVIFEPPCTNRQTIPVEPLYDIKFGVWCAVSATTAFGPFFFGIKLIQKDTACRISYHIFLLKT